MFGFAIRTTKKHKYVCIIKDGECGNFTTHDHAYVNSLFPSNTQNPVENIYCILDKNVDIEKKLLDVGFEKDNPKAKDIIGYMKEQGSLVNY